MFIKLINKLKWDVLYYIPFIIIIVTAILLQKIEWWRVLLAAIVALFFIILTIKWVGFINKLKYKDNRGGYNHESSAKR